MAHDAFITRRAFGRLDDGREVDEYTLDAGGAITLSCLTLGGIVHALHAPGRDGRMANVVLGFASLQDHLRRNRNFGTLVGRHANRIAGARFLLEGQQVRLAANDGANALHGGPEGFGARLWQANPLGRQPDGSVALELSLTSADGDQGYPGELQVSVRYTLTPADEWRLDWQATTDRTTVVNLTHHTYWNLAGVGSALDHRLTLAAQRYAAVDATLIPQRFEAVEGTPFDFRQPAAVGARIRQPHEQIVRARGYDHHFEIDREGPGLAFAARLEDPASGRVLEIATTEPGIQFYSGNFLDGSLVGRHGATLRQGDGLCLETQHPPDAPNPPALPSTVLRPGQTFRSTTVHRLRAA